MSFQKQIEQVHVYRKDWGAKPNLNVKQKSFDKFNFYIKEKGKGREIALGGKRVVIFNKGDYEIIKGEGSKDGLRSEEHTSELQSRGHLVCRLLLEKKNKE